jgi:3-methylfumaryl-CoA hydratase
MSREFDEWIGREEIRTERITPFAAEALAATLDIAVAPADGDPLPPGWQWMYFNPAVRRSGLGADGHPQRGGFLPPITLPRRMWAGSRIRYMADLLIGDEASRRSRIAKVENKVGKRGSLWFVTVEHTTTARGEACIVEEQDIVYREASPANAAATAAPRHEAEHEWAQVIQPDTTLLFRYSALTFNGHRIHYDQPYARNEENYPDLVVHGPLTATLLQKFAVECADGRPLSRFEFRGVSPLFVSRPFRLEGHRLEDGTLSVWARGPEGELAVSAVAAFR